MITTSEKRANKIIFYISDNEKRIFEKKKTIEKLKKEYEEIEKKMEEIKTSIEYEEQEVRYIKEVNENYRKELRLQRMQASAEKFCEVFVERQEGHNLTKQDILTRFIEIYGKDIIDTRNSRETKRFFLRITKCLGKGTLRKGVYIGYKLDTD